MARSTALLFFVLLGTGACGCAKGKGIRGQAQDGGSVDSAGMTSLDGPDSDGATGGQDSATTESVTDAGVGAGQDAADGAQRLPPYALKFVFRNPGQAPVGLDRGCAGRHIAISSAASAYSDDLSPSLPQCVCDCRDLGCIPPGCPDCPVSDLVAVAAGSQTEFNWMAETVQAETLDGHACARHTALPAGQYRVAVNVYLAEAGGGEQLPPRKVVTDFLLPAWNDTVYVDMVPCGDPDTMARWPACSSARDRASCVAAGGKWAIDSGGSCVCTTGQESCSCTSDLQCLDRCMTAAPAAPPQACRGVTAGRCGGLYGPGCFCYFHLAGAAPEVECSDPP
jgi:hypothetical protein